MISSFDMQNRFKFKFASQQLFSFYKKSINHSLSINNLMTDLMMMVQYKR